MTALLNNFWPLFIEVSIKFWWQHYLTPFHWNFNQALMTALLDNFQPLFIEISIKFYSWFQNNRPLLKKLHILWVLNFDLWKVPEIPNSVVSLKSVVCCTSCNITQWGVTNAKILVMVKVGWLSVDYIHDVWDTDNHDYSNNHRIIKSPPEAIQQFSAWLSKLIILSGL